LGTRRRYGTGSPGIILLVVGDTSPIRDGVARDDYFISIFWHVIAYEASGGRVAGSMGYYLVLVAINT
jgi:hypothetical protein